MKQVFQNGIPLPTGVLKVAYYELGRVSWISMTEHSNAVVVSLL